MLSRAVASVFFAEHRPPKMPIHGLYAGVARDSCLPCKRYCRAPSRAAAYRAPVALLVTSRVCTFMGCCLGSPKHIIGLLPDTANCGLRRRREYWRRFPRHRGLAIPTCMTARAWRTCRHACRYHWLAVSFEVGSGENYSCIPGACATRNFAYLVRGPWTSINSLLN